jgi:hypothetical protein
MGFDDEVDQLKRELQTPKLDAAAIGAATSELQAKLSQRIQSRRLEFTLIEGDVPAIGITHIPSKERLATIALHEDGRVTFQSSFGEDAGEDVFEDGGYFPPYVEYYDQDEFLEEAPEMLKQGIAEFELDQEEGD